MAYQVLSRKYRPRTFDQVVGQTHITETLKKAIESGRIAQAYIFSGTRGTGKTTMARILAKALNCVNGPTPNPCNECEVCTAVDTGEDVDVIEIDGASHNSVEDVRELRSNASYTPARSRYKIYYIDEVHMLSNAAFNALLKTLEEPPAHVKFIFATTEPHKIPLTIQSRCQRFDFRNIPPDAILARLADICKREKLKAEEGALALVSRFAQGSMRDAESLLDQVVSFSGDRVTRKSVEDVLGVIPSEALSNVLTALAEGSTAGALEGVEVILSAGGSPRQFVAEFVDYLRDVLVAKTCGSDSPLLVRSIGEKEALAADAAKWDQSAIIYAMQLLSETYARMARSPQTRGLLDVAVVKLAQTEDFLRLKAFLNELREGPIAPRSAQDGGGRLPFEPSRVNGLAAPAEHEAAAPGDGSWKGIISRIATRHSLAATVLVKCDAKLDGDRLAVAIPSSLAFNKANIEKPEVRDALEVAASEAYGHAVQVHFTVNGSGNGMGEPAQESSSARKRALKEKVLEDPTVKKVIELFDGSLIDVEDTNV